MRKFIYSMFAIMAMFSVASCGSDDEEIAGTSIVGEWSGFPEDEEIPNGIINLEMAQSSYIHFTFRANGTYTQVMIAWEQKREGTYKIEGDSIIFHMTKMEWLWDRENGAYNAYDERLNPLDGVYDSQRDATYENFAKQYPEEIDFKGKFKFNNMGNLIIEGEQVTYNLPLIFYKDKDKYTLPTTPL